MGNEVDFPDGQGPKSKDTPDEFASDWHYQAHLEALERDVAGRLHRLEELKGMAATHPSDLEAAEDAVKVAKARLAEYEKGAKSQKAAVKRPRRAKETRRK